MFCLTDFVQGLSYKGVQDRQVSVVIFFIYIYIFFCFAVGMGNLKQEPIISHGAITWCKPYA